MGDRRVHDVLLNGCLSEHALSRHLQHVGFHMAIKKVQNCALACLLLNRDHVGHPARLL